MDPNFWHNRWEKNEIAFHAGAPSPFLVKYFKELLLKEGSRVFLPLCGKTLDISWLLASGYRVVGAELSKIAIEQLFEELGVEPEITGLGEIERYSATNIDVFVGDIFALTGNLLGAVDAIYDRAALVALPEEMRKRYAAHLKKLTNNAPQLLITYEYDQSQVEGPPFSISEEELSGHYAGSYNISFLAGTDVAGGMKGKCEAREKVWLLTKKRFS